ncbi:MAG TPA: response regulator [Cellvibrionaceae bacterium]
MSAEILLIEDDADLRHTLQAALSCEGYRVTSAVSLREARALLQHRPAHLPPWDIWLLDLNLPDGSGCELLQHLPSKGPTACIVITAHAEEERVAELLDAGADGYLVKPFGVLELFARIRLALRQRGNANRPLPQRYQHQGLEVDLASHQVSLNGQPCHLTPKEFALLSCLIARSGQLVLQRQLLSDVWGAQAVEHSHYLRLYMAQLRQKLGDSALAPRWLFTETGLGYRLARNELS